MFFPWTCLSRFSLQSILPLSHIQKISPLLDLYVFRGREIDGGGEVAASEGGADSISPVKVAEVLRKPWDACGRRRRKVYVERAESFFASDLAALKY